MIHIKQFGSFAAVFLIWVVILILCMTMISEITQKVTAIVVLNSVYVVITSLGNLIYFKYEQVGSAIKIAIHLMNTIFVILTAVIIGITVHYANVDAPNTIVFICFALIFALVMLAFQLDAINYRRWKLGYEYVTYTRSEAIA